MARITVEDCVEVVPSRFDLVVLAAQRVRQIMAGAQITVSRTGNKAPIVSLREIASQTVSTEDLMEAVVRNFRKYRPQEDLEEDEALLEKEKYNPCISASPVNLSKDGDSDLPKSGAPSSKEDNP
ncbi:MAG: DNA-directed RNA polymerase subunit omega [Holosporales bacterium]|jgi:DNA-directed RNA polymerase subunit omega|nr:DNA-directed RNA polymerase subunit omega [Holosporales bacterium]